MQRVDMERIPRRSQEQAEMTPTTPKKPELHGAAAASHTKAEAAKDQGKPANGKPKDTGRMPSNAGNKSDSGRKSR